MENFSYVNIFETKGIEYLVIIAFLMLMIPFSIILNRKVRAASNRSRFPGTLAGHLRKIPQGMFFSRHHSWAFLQKSGIASIGMDDLLSHLTGEVRLQGLLDPGQHVRRGDPIAEILQEEKRLRIFSPVSGIVQKMNHRLDQEPELLQEDPYGEGWICRIKPTDWKGEMNHCFVADSATEWSKRELDRFRDFLAVTMKTHNPALSAVILQDGGEISLEALRELPPECWQDFQRDFLDPGELKN